MRAGFIKELNTLFSAFQKAGHDYEKHIGKGVSLESTSGEVLRKDIPQILKEEFPADTYKIKGSIGTGRISKCPWVAIMHNKETSSTKRGIYLVFLFTKDLNRVYLSLAQGVSEITMAEINKNRKTLRGELKLESTFRRHFNDQLIDSDEYKAGAIYSNEWKCTDESYCESLLLQFKEAYEKYIALKYGESDDSLSTNPTTKADGIESEFSIKAIIDYIKETGLVYSESLIKRFAFSLLTKPFVILSGLAGSGKTQLALAFASALVEDREKQMCVVSVGADWTNREPLLGFPNALQPDQYVKPESGVLDLLIEANRKENAEKPFFLILDEMNMSYVERYFADFLSAMESHEPISLWKGMVEAEAINYVPQKVELPKNLFIIGTINVDETTYMFSPKVLDRANVIEFKIASEEMAGFLTEMQKINRDCINGRAVGMAKRFVEEAAQMELAKDEEAVMVLQKFFDELKGVNAEFGYRSAMEIFRFICQAKGNDDTTIKMTTDEILDAAIMQKLLPKLHGSRKKLVPILANLWDLCDAGIGIELAESVPPQTKYPLTADKLLRMYRGAIDNGFTSFAEA